VVCRDVLNRLLDVVINHQLRIEALGIHDGRKQIAEAGDEGCLAEGQFVGEITDRLRGVCAHDSLLREHYRVGGVGVGGNHWLMDLDKEASQTRNYCGGNRAAMRGSPRSLAAQRTLARDDTYLRITLAAADRAGSGTAECGRRGRG
jgi:hypothetical protein